MVSSYRMRAILRDHYGMNSYLWTPDVEDKAKELKRLARKGGASAMMRKVREDNNELDKPRIPVPKADYENVGRQITLSDVIS